MINIEELPYSGFTVKGYYLSLTPISSTLDERIRLIRGERTSPYHREMLKKVEPKYYFFDV